MPHRVYSEINLHITWHTKTSTPLITKEIENEVHKFIRKRVFEEPDVIFHAVGGIENHIHLAVSIPSNLEIATWIGRLKGSCSHYINRRVLKRKYLQWQRGYGVVSFGTKDLGWVVDYVMNQRKRHKSRLIFDRLETFEC